jgi:hypothetical protein
MDLWDLHGRAEKRPRVDMLELDEHGLIADLRVSGHSPGSRHSGFRHG